MSPEEIKARVYGATETTDWTPIDPRARFCGRHAHPSARIMPATYQPHHLRRLQEASICFEDFLPDALLDRLLGAVGEMALVTGNHSRPMRVESGALVPGPDQLDPARLGEDRTAVLNAAMDAAIALVHQRLDPFTQPDAIAHYNVWVNTGPIGEPLPLLPQRYHFWHYDSDESLEFETDQKWVRFPIWAGILYLHQPEDCVHHTVLDPKTIHQKIRSKTNRLLLFDPRYLHSVSGPPTREDQNLRTVLVFNAWDYFVRDTGVHMRYLQGGGERP